MAVSPPSNFEPNFRAGPGYEFIRGVFVGLVWLLFRPIVSGRQHVPESGPVILAPVHRSFADFTFPFFLTRRKLFVMAKAELWENRFLGWFLTSVGVFPVHRDVADREALRIAQRVLEQGQVLVVFPEGTRKAGPTVQEAHEGAVFLAARTGAPMVPVGIGGSDVSMPKGRRVPKLMRITVVAGEALPAPRGDGGRVPRSAMHAATEELRRRIQAAYDTARRPYEGQAGSA